MRLSDALAEDAVEIRAKARDWEEAVRKAGGLLVRSGAAEERYTGAMVSMIKRCGPYVVIAPGLAVPHARPEEGALRAGLGVLVLEKPVEFGSTENDPVDILIPFSSGSTDAHLEILSLLASFLARPGMLDRIRVSRSPHEVRALFGEWGNG